MASLVVVRGPNVGRGFPLAESGAVLGRDQDAGVCLESLSVSRRHARVWMSGSGWLVEDLSSSNGTFRNGRQLRTAEPLAEGDELRVGPYVLAFRLAPPALMEDTDLVVREEVGVDASSATLTDEADRVLESVLMIGRELAGSLDAATLPDRLLERLFVLFPRADRGLVIMCEGDRLAPRACRARAAGEPEYRFSRTVARRALDEGLGILSDDVRADPRFQGVPTVAGLDVRSVMCAPLLGSGGRSLGVVQLDCHGAGRSFTRSDLRLLAAVAMHMASALENAALHTELLREEQLRRDVAVAQKVQQDYLPPDRLAGAGRGFELVARSRPARDVSGDLCDFCDRPDGSIALLVADVCGKGLPAALAMLGVRSVARHPAMSAAGPFEALTQLNTALSADNRSGLFVTALYGVYKPESGELLLASCGHSAPLLRRADGSVEEINLPGGVPLGIWSDSPARGTQADVRVVLNPGDAVLFFTDGLPEATDTARVRFGPARLREAFAGPQGMTPAAERADRIEEAIDAFTGDAEPADDRTFLLLQRSA